ncbi:hypothetical protein [Corynebacterium sp. HMSC04H06]|uniref:hypothetical protein n=1 Tax=Corynebacterium sp. HMSC04H06 TaxID=1581050 RepID=UPI00114D3729|nr:hypothetical protein [Corynebacterium sp. HMSC04H06]
MLLFNINQFRHPPAVANTNSDKSAEITRELSESFETVFTEVVSEQPTGQWEPNYENAAKHGLSAQEADALAEFMETPLSQERHPEQPDIATRDLGSFAECVVWNIAPAPMSPQDAQAIGRLLKDKQWSQAAEKITQVAALNGATAALDYGISAIGGPVAWAAKLALYAGSCALNEQM